MLKISEVGPPGSCVTLRLEGRIVGPWVRELRVACDKVLTKGRSVRLLLADLEFMDAGGVALLGELRSRGVSFSEAPPFVAEQLKPVAG